MPPSLNALYANHSGHGRGRHKTKEYLEFDRSAKIWAFHHHQEILNAKNALKDSPFLEIHCVFYFPEGRLLTKKGLAKRLDVDNRLKALFDRLVTILELDDSCFFRCHCHKLVHDRYNCDITILKLNKEDLYAVDPRKIS